MTASDVFVSVVAPLQDDDDVLAPFVVETVAVLTAQYANFELVLVDDGSRDGTSTTIGQLLAAHPCVRYIRLSRRFGLEAAIAAGLDSVIGDYTVVMLPAMDPPALIPELVARCREGKGIVFGVCRARPGHPFWASAGSRWYWALGRRFLDLHVPEGASYFQCLSRSAVNGVTRIKDKYRSIRLLASSMGADLDTLPYEPLRRRSRPRTRGFLESLDLAAGITVSRSTRPLRFVAALGLLASFLNLLYMGYVVTIYLTRSHVAEGWTTTSLQVSGMFFLLFVIMSVLSEYVGRVLEESRDRPLYHAVEERSSNVMVRDGERRNVVGDST
jgi:dolichol-phosphate mannosyltransferase